MCMYEYTQVCVCVCELTVLWKTTLCPLPKLSMCVTRLRQMARWRMASMVWASKKSWGLAKGRTTWRVWELMTSHFTHYTAVVVFMKVIVLRSERRCLFFSFLLLLRPALDGDSSFGLFWLDNLDEPCELKWVGTWRASPPCEANVALHPPTTHCSNREEMIWFHIARTGASNNDLVQRFPIRTSFCTGSQ